jgi:hypothetical protein
MVHSSLYLLARLAVARNREPAEQLLGLQTPDKTMERVLGKKALKAILDNFVGKPVGNNPVEKSKEEE